MGLMSRPRLILVAVLVVINACSGAEPMAPDEEHPAIPQLTAAQCAVWSCSVGDCQQDPALYGACCIQAASAEYPATSAPSCQYTPQGGTPEWCGAGNTHTACLERRSEDASFSGDCSSTTYLDDRGIAYPVGSDAWNDAFPECVQ